MPTGDRTITVVRQARVDKLSTTSPDSPDETVITGVVVLPQRAREEDGGWVTLEGLDVFILPSSRVQTNDAPRAYEDGDILAADKVTLDGVTYQVKGPAAKYTKSTRLKGVQFLIEKVGGAS